MDHCNRHEDHDDLGSFTVLFMLVAPGTESGSWLSKFLHTGNLPWYISVKQLTRKYHSR